MADAALLPPFELVSFESTAPTPRIGLADWDALDRAAESLARNDAAEALIWLGRADPAFARLPDLAQPKA